LRCVVGIGGGFMLGILRDHLSGRLEAHQVKRAVQLRNIMTSLGPAYIKLGQARLRPCWVAGCFPNSLTEFAMTANVCRRGPPHRPRLMSGGSVLCKTTTACMPTRPLVLHPVCLAVPVYLQALSIRPDLLSPAAMAELQRLCDKVWLASGALMSAFLSILYMFL